MTRHFKPRTLQHLHHVGAVFDRTRIDGSGHRAVNALARIIFPARECTAVVTLERTLTLRVFSVHELVALHYHLTPRLPVIFVRARRCNVHGLARLELHTRRHEVQLFALSLLVQYPRDVVLVALKTRKCVLLERIHEPLTYLRFHPLVLLRGERKYTVRVAVQTLLGVDEISRRFGVTAQNHRLRVASSRLGEVRGEHTARRSFAALRDEFYEHPALTLHPPGQGAVPQLQEPEALPGEAR